MQRRRHTPRQWQGSAIFPLPFLLPFFLFGRRTVVSCGRNPFGMFILRFLASFDGLRIYVRTQTTCQMHTWHVELGGYEVIDNARCIFNVHLKC